jgi:hypothetical protein
MTGAASVEDPLNAPQPHVRPATTTTKIGVRHWRYFSAGTKSAHLARVVRSV